MKLKLTFPILMVALIATIACARLMSHAQDSAAPYRNRGQAF